MSAQDNISRHQFQRPDTLYHGSAHRFEPGDLVQPGHRQNYPQKFDPDTGEEMPGGGTLDRERPSGGARHVFATSDIKDAYHAARSASSIEPEKGYGVYEVKPMGRITADRESLANGESPEEVNSFQSRQPFRVVGERTRMARDEFKDNYGADWNSD